MRFIPPQVPDQDFVPRFTGFLFIRLVDLASIRQPLQLSLFRAPGIRDAGALFGDWSGRTLSMHLIRLHILVTLTVTARVAFLGCLSRYSSIRVPVSDALRSVQLECSPQSDATQKHQQQRKTHCLCHLRQHDIEHHTHCCAYELGGQQGTQDMVVYKDLPLQGMPLLEVQNESGHC